MRIDLRARSILCYSDAAMVDQDAVQSRVGTTLRGKYHLERVIGVGGMAAVYEATHRNGKRFAIKILHAHLAERDDTRRRFVREGYVANAVDHPGAVSVLDDDVGDDGAAFLVMELLVGEALDQLWKEQDRRFALPVVVEVARQLLAVLASAHAHSIVHRDIKPANLFVTRDGTLKVLDFGIARVRDATIGDASLTGIGAVLGTPAYMAPEQALADTDRIDGRTDLWAVGATMFALITGRFVHEATNPSALLIKAASARAPALASVVPGVDERVAAIVDRALAIEPAARWQSAAAMIAATDAAGPAGKVPLAALVAPRTRRPSVSQEAFDATSAPAGPPEKVPTPTPATARARPQTSQTVASAIAVSPPREPAPHAARLALGGVAAAAAALAFAGWWFAHTSDSDSRPTAAASGIASARARGAAESGQAAVAIVFANETSDPMLDATLDVVFQSALYRSPLVQPYAGPTLHQLADELGASASDVGVAKLLHARDGGRVVAVRGHVASKGRGYAISIDVTDAATGAAVLTTTADATSGNDVIPVVGGLAAQLVHALGGSAPAAPTAPTGMSDSLEADHEAVVSRELASSGKYADSIAHVQRALSLDPQFAFAHEQLAIDYWNLGRIGEAEHELKLGMRSIDAMSDHDRLKFLGDYYGIEGELDRSIASLTELLAKWPADATSEGNLALIYAQKRDVANALAVGGRVAAKHPRAIHPRTNLAIFEVLAGRFGDAARDAGAVIAEFAHPPQESYVYLGVSQHQLGHDDDALAALGQLESVDTSEAAAARADLLLADGRIQEAVGLLEVSTGVDDRAGNRDAAARKHAMLAEAWLREGNLARALAEADHAADASVPSTRFIAARSYVAAGKPDRASLLADKLLDELAPDSRMYGQLVRGEVELARGKSRDAIDAFEEAGRIDDAWLVHDALVRAYLARGAYAEARSELDTCTARVGEATIAFMDDLSAPTTRYLAYARYYLARAQEGIGSPDAKASYEAFVAAQPTGSRDAVVADAHARLAHLSK
jgi:serine/threonine protein kinase/tetratricopeptide (TPR) repeat protein